MVRAGAAKVVAEFSGFGACAMAWFVAEHERSDSVGEVFATEAKGSKAGFIALWPLACTSRPSPKFADELLVRDFSEATSGFESFHCGGEFLVCGDEFLIGHGERLAFL